MSELSNEPIGPGEGPTSIFQTWMTALTKPNEATYAELAASPMVKASTAYLWVFIAGIASSIATGIVQLTSGVGASGSALESTAGSSIALFCAVPLGAGLYLLIFMGYTAVVQSIAKMFGGTGDYTRMVYVFGAIAAPVSFISAGLTVFSVIPYIGVMFALISLALGIYVLFLNTMAVKGVNQFGWGPALGSVFIPTIVILFLITCLVIGVLMLLGPVIGDVFSEINQGLVP